MYKVFRERALPAPSSDAVSVTAARNDYEPFQIVLRPSVPMNNVRVAVTDFSRIGGGGLIASNNFEACLVEYVHVKELYDSYSALGMYPDPLPVLQSPFNVSAGTNQPIWITVYVPKSTPAGTYLGAVTISSDTEVFDVPVRIQVYNFTLADVSHTKMAIGLHVDGNWHGRPSTAQQLQIWELYMQNYGKHRMSPYIRDTVAPLWPAWSFVNGTFIHNFTNFDSTVGRWVDEYSLNSFKFLHEPATLGGYARFTPEYRQLFIRLAQPITEHLREKGWLDEAYSFWLDEVQPHQFPYLKQGMQLHLQAAPGMKRLLTFWQADAAMDGQADIWCPLLSTSTYDYVQRRWAQTSTFGDEGWWFVASVPSAPLPNNFIDHPSISPRIRAWMQEKCGATGELLWYGTWYFGANSQVKNPWEDPMSENHQGDNLGNGNGVVIYPPVKVLPSSPLIAGPVNSIRWEMMREGQEDREFFWLLKQLLERAERRLGTTAPTVVEGYAARQAALALVPSVSNYEKNPAMLYEARNRIAQAIEALSDGAPIIVKQPDSQVGSLSGVVTLRAEAIGWPTPSYQWQKSETDIPGATRASLTLSNVSAADAGTYRLIASNAAGTAQSHPAEVGGKWEQAPHILIHPQSVVRAAETHAVFAITAVGASPMEYQWWFNGSPFPYATNSSLLLTNLSASQSGSYHLIVTNLFGSATSHVATLSVPVLLSNAVLVPRGSIWRYSDQGLNLGTTWRNPSFNDTAWPSGPAQLGYGDGDEQTLIGFGSDPQNKFITTYFRKNFTNSAASAPSKLVLHILKDDGAVASLNGSEVYRSANMPSGTINYTSLAQGFWEMGPMDGEAESNFYPKEIWPGYLRSGTNTVAVEIHQHSTASDDLSFDFELVGSWLLPPQIYSGPSNLICLAGDSALFKVEAASAGSVTYQWNKNETPLPNATSAMLVLPGVSISDAAVYSVSVSNAAGATTSSTASLTVLAPPVLSGGQDITSQSFYVSIPPLGVPMMLQVSTNLVNWLNVLLVAPSEEPGALWDGIQGSASKFYRLRTIEE